MDMVTASRTKHKDKTLGTGNGYQLHRQSPHLSWNLQGCLHIWSQVLGLAQNCNEKPRGGFSFSHRTLELERVGRITLSKMFIL